MAITPPLTLASYIAEGRCILFVGAGLSASAGLPGWAKLLGNMVQQVRDQAPGRPDLPQLDSLLKSGRFLQVADYCRERLGDAQYFMFLREQLKPTARGILPTHETITKLPFRAIVTTNYDKLLERAYALLTEDTPPILTHDEEAALGVSLFDNPFFILKAHGDISNPESIILTSRDYRRITHERPAFSSVFSALLMSNAVLFLGYSLGDPDLNLLLDGQLSVFKDVVPPRFALMEDVGEVGALVLKKSAGIDVQSYEKGRHEQVLEYLHALKIEVDKRLPPEHPMAPVTTEMAALPEAPSRSISPPGVTIGVKAQALTSLSMATLLLKRQENSLLCLFRSHDGTQFTGTGTLPPAELFAASVGRSVMTEKGVTPEARTVGEQLLGALPREMVEAIRQLSDQSVLVLDVAPELETIPWEWVQIDGQYLCMRTPLVRSPIGISESARGTRAVRANVRILLIGDTLNNLQGAREEIEKIGIAYGGRRGTEIRTLMGEQATCEAVLKYLEKEQFDLVHFAGHAWYDREDAYLMCHDQEPLKARDLQSFLARSRPPVVFLNSHWTAFVPPGVQGGEMQDPLGKLSQDARQLDAGMKGKRGFTGATAAAGVGAFIGCLGSPSDDGAAIIGLEFHEEVLRGTPAALALFRARRALAGIQSQDTTSLVYVLSGRAEIALPSAE